MNIYPEIKKIACLNHKMRNLKEKLEKRIDVEGLMYDQARLIEGCTEKNGHLYMEGCRLDNSGLVDGDYYCNQYTGYLGDDYYGTLYFKTDVPGQFVAVPFEM